MSLDAPISPRDVPPPVDLAGHMRDLGRALLPALLIAVIVGGAVFAVRSLLVPKEYEASVIAEITPAQTLIPGDAFIEQMRAPFVGLAEDSDVLNQVLWEVDTGWDTQELREHIRLSPGDSPALLVFTATANDPETARQLARTMVINVARKAAANDATAVARQLEGLQAAIAAEQAHVDSLAPEDPNRVRSEERLAELRSNVGALQNSSSDQLTVLSTPDQSLAPVSPRPLPEAMVAGVVTLIIAAELIVLSRGRFGARPNRVWARRAAQRHHAQFGVGDHAMSGLSPAAMATVVRARNSDRRVLVLLGDSAARPTLPKVAGTGRPAGHPPDVAALDDEWWFGLADHTAVIVVVSTAGSDRKLAERTLRQLDEMAVPASLVLQPRRKRRRRAAAAAVVGEAKPAPEGPSTEAAEALPTRNAEDHAS